MSYLTDFDFTSRIQTEHLSQLTGASAAVLKTEKDLSVQMAKEHLVQKYDTSREFVDVEAYDSLKTYTLPARVYYNSEIYNTVLPFDYFDYNLAYKTGDKVFFGDRVYTALTSVNANGANPDTLPSVWSAAGSASTVGPGLIANTTKWTKKDDRSVNLVSNLVDIVIYNLFARISPNNIPLMRTERYKDAVKWLRSCGDGSITAGIPRLNPFKGMRIRYGNRGHINNNNY
jgi:hypothetical protein